MHQELTKLFQKTPKLSLKKIEEKLQLHTTEQLKELREALLRLEEEKKILNDHANYIWIDNDDYFIGRVKDVSKFELALINPEGKVYVPKSNAQDAFERDEVLVRKKSGRQSDRSYFFAGNQKHYRKLLPLERGLEVSFRY